MTSVDHARQLLQRAAEDQYILRKIADDPAAPPNMVGFHAQQAVEKMLKAVLASRDIDYPRTHELRHLMKILEECGCPLPDDLADIRKLEPFATRFRYDYSVQPSEAPDRAWIADRIERIERWATRLIEAR